MLKEIIDVFIHLDDKLIEIVTTHGKFIYGLLFLIIFCETGLVIMPFLPGDSLLFAVGAVAARPELQLNIWYCAGLMFSAAVIGDTLNYWVGRKTGTWLSEKFPRLIKPSYLKRTKVFFEKYGGKTVILARFIPIVRTFTPFVAGSGSMSYPRFLTFSIVGTIFWVGLLVPAGFFFGGLPFVKNNFEFVVIGIICISILPVVITALKERLQQSR
jgi:membrane-associated protein